MWGIIAPVASGIITAMLGWLVGRMQSRAKETETEKDALKGGVRALLRSELMHDHHAAVRAGYISTTDREILQRTYTAYHNLHGNDVATRLYNEAMDLPTREDSWGHED